tara:strand:+ start:401 stop:514 length:114 start_codon:yes stop_codon:yes gene_type:complete
MINEKYKKTSLLKKRGFLGLPIVVVPFRWISKSDCKE